MTWLQIQKNVEVWILLYFCLMSQNMVRCWKEIGVTNEVKAEVMVCGRRWQQDFNLLLPLLPLLDYTEHGSEQIRREFLSWFKPLIQHL